MAVLTRHSRRQKEAVRKRGPSLRDKAQQLGLKGSVRVLVIHEDPTHGVWHIAKHCPPGLTFPDIDELVREYDKTRQRPRVRPCCKHALPHQNVRRISTGCPQDEQVSDDEAVTTSMGSISSDSADPEDMGDCVGGAADVAIDCFEESLESLDCFSDDDLASVDQMITPQLEETGFQAYRRLLRWIWGS